MEHFEKWCDEVEYMCVDYTKRDALRRGWKAALKFVLKNRKPYYNIDDKKVVATDSDIIYKELEE